jgi:azurin
MILSMKNNYLLVFALWLLLAACGGNNQQKIQDTTAAAKAEETDPASIPGIDKIPLTDTISLQANDDMHFDKDLFKIKSGKKIILRLKNIGSEKGMPMSHNVVVLKKGTDIAIFADSARLARRSGFIPAALASSIIAHTGLVSAGKSEQIEFTINQPGVYDFICSYEGHWGTMQGKIVAQ